MDCSGTWLAALTITVEGQEIDLQELSVQQRNEIALGILHGNTQGTFQHISISA